MALAYCEDRAKLQKAIRKAVDVKGDIQVILHKTRVEVLDFDSLTSEGEVSDLLKKDFSYRCSELKVTLFVPNQREQRRHSDECKRAYLVLQKGKEKVGCVSCRVQQCLEVDLSFRCLSYGHTEIAQALTGTIAVGSVTSVTTRLLRGQRTHRAFCAPIPWSGKGSCSRVRSMWGFQEDQRRKETSVAARQ